MISHTLYKKDSKGKTREWTIQVEGSKHRVVSGIKDGKLIISEWTQCKVKNEGRANATTAEDQAEREALALVKKQKDKGYTEDVEDIEEAAVFKCMLAEDFNEYVDDLVFPVYSQPKLDGIRCIITKDGMKSRNGKPIVSCPHIFESLQKVFERYPDYIFDGELYNHAFKNDFNKICSLVKRTKPTEEDIEESARLVQYWVYDLVDTSVFSVRQSMLINLFLPDAYIKDSCLVLVPTEKVEDKQTLDTLYEQYMACEYEGQMGRIDKPYQHKRTKFLLKRKEWKDFESRIKSVEEGEGNRTGMVGFMNFETADGKPFKSNVKGSHKYLKELWEQADDLIGLTATIKYFNLTPDGIPRFPYVIKIGRELYE